MVLSNMRATHWSAHEAYFALYVNWWCDAVWYGYCLVVAWWCGGGGVAVVLGGDALMLLCGDVVL